MLTGVRINRLASNTAFDHPFDLWGNFSYQIQCSVHSHMVHTVQILKLCASYTSHGNCSLLCLFLDGQPTLFLSMSVNLLYFFLKASTPHSASKPNLVSSSPSIQLVQFDAAYVIDFPCWEIDYVSYDPSRNSNGDFDKIVEGIDLFKKKG